MVLKQSMSYGFVRHTIHIAFAVCICPYGEKDSLLNSVWNLSAVESLKSYNDFLLSEFTSLRFSTINFKGFKNTNVDFSSFNLVLRKCKEKVCSALAPYMFYICIATEGGT